MNYNHYIFLTSVFRTNIKKYDRILTSITTNQKGKIVLLYRPMPNSFNLLCSLKINLGFTIHKVTIVNIYNIIEKCITLFEFNISNLL